MEFMNRVSIVSSIIAALLLFLAGLTSILQITIPSLIFGFLLVPTFIVLMACIHFYSRKETKIFSMLGVIFACMYGVFISFNYYLQLTLVRIHTPGLELFVMTDPNSMMWVIEVLGYFFMGLSTLFSLFIFGSTILERSIKVLFFLNGILGIGGLIGWAIGLHMSILMIGLLLWNIIMPVVAILLAFYFKMQVSISNKRSTTASNRA